MKSLIIAVLLLPTAALAQGGPYGTQIPRIQSPRPMPLPQAQPFPPMVPVQPPPLMPAPLMQAPPACVNTCGPYGCQMVCY